MPYVVLTRDAKRQPRAVATNSLPVARKRARQHAKAHPESGAIIYKMGGSRRITAVNTRGDSYTIGVAGGPVDVIEPHAKN